MKKVIVVAEFDTFGGTRTFFKGLVEYYKYQGKKVVVCLNRSQIDEDIISFANKNEITISKISDGTGWLKRRSATRRIFRFFQQIKIVFAVLREQPQQVSISVGTPGLYYSLLYLPFPSIYILHTYPHSVNGRPIRARKNERLLRSIPLSQRKKIVTVSKKARDSIVFSWIKEPKEKFVKVIPNTAGKLPEFERKIEEKARITILTLGHVNWYKNPADWLKVAKSVVEGGGDRQVIFVWAGDGAKLETCRESVINMGLEDKIRFIGYVEDIDILFREADIYFQPSLIESQGLSVLTAMKYQLPCIVSDAGGLPESVENEETGFVVPVNDIEAFVDVVKQLVDSETKRNNMGRLGQRRYVAMFGEGEWRKKMDLLHQELYK